MTMAPINPAVDETRRNRASWNEKPLLRAIYARFYGELRGWLRPGPTLEIGSGIGQIREFIPGCVTSDVLPGPGIDRVESAYALSASDGSFANIILFDVWHHLRYPGSALGEFRRVLEPGGRLLLFEPAMGALPRMIYGLFHHEPLGFGEPIEWEPQEPFDRRAPRYFAAQSRAWRIFHRREGSALLEGWRVTAVRAWSDFAYLASGGFSRPALYPAVARGAIEAVDRLLTRISPRLFAARLIVVLEKAD